MTTKVGACDPTAISVNPGTRLVLDDISASQIFKGDAGPNKILIGFSDMAPYLPAQSPKSWSKRNVLFFRKRGIGDELCLTAIVRYFKERLGANCFVLCHASTESVWHANDSIVSMVSEPLALDAFYRVGARAFFDHAFFFESVTEFDSEPDQGNVYDTLFRMTGIDPGNVAARYKRPYLRLDEKDEAGKAEWLNRILASTGAQLSRGYIVYQLSTTNPVRSLPASRSIEALRALNGCNLPVLAIDDKPPPYEVSQAMDQLPNVYSVGGTLATMRLYFAVVAGAALVVGPDSSALHVAAAFDVPSVGFWGPFSPESRTKYYPHHVGIWDRDRCINSPCFYFKGTVEHPLPTHLCPKGALQRSCEVFEGITQESVLEAVTRAAPGVL